MEVIKTWQGIKELFKDFNAEIIEENQWWKEFINFQLNENEIYVIKIGKPFSITIKNLNVHFDTINSEKQIRSADKNKISTHIFFNMKNYLVAELYFLKE